MPGTYRKRGKDSYRLEVCIGTDYRGKPMRYSKTVHCKSDKEADKELAKFYVECETGTASKPSLITLSAFCDIWLTDYAKVKLKQATMKGYLTIIEQRIKPTIGNLQLKKITPAHIQKWINDLYNEKNLTYKTIKNTVSVLNTIFNTAVKWQYLSKNPCSFVDLPKRNVSEAKYYTKEEVSSLLTALETVPLEEQKYKVCILLALLCGLRRGEILGLNWDDVDFNEEVISIVRNRNIGVDGKIYEDTPKTDKSARTIAMPSLLTTELKILEIEEKKKKIKLGSKWQDSPAVITSNFGAALWPTIPYQWFKSFQDNNGLPPISLHGLRHTHTSLLAYAGSDKMQISRRLGHSQLSTTLNTYTHLFEDTDKAIAKKIDNLLSEIK